MGPFADAMDGSLFTLTHQLAASGGSAFCLVWAGGMTAPRHRSAIGIILGLLHAVTLAVLFTLVVVRQRHMDWWNLINAVVAIAATVFACILLHGDERRTPMPASRFTPSKN